MGFLEALGFGRKRLAEGELLEALLKAARTGEQRQFAKLCREHVEVIAAATPRWKKPPEQVIKNPEALNEYIQTVGHAAELLRDLGHPQLWDALVGNPDDNPIVIWERKLDDAKLLAKELRFDEAAELLMNQLIDGRHLQGNAVGHLQALTQGLLGHLRKNAGKVDLSIGHHEQALRLCREQMDAEGVRVYLEHLYESHRYLGRREPAADYARELGQAWDAAGNADLARRFSKLSQLVREGEPLLRIVAHCDGKVLELDEVENRGSMTLEMHFWRNRPSLPGAQNRIERGKELAGKQQHDEALELFREAAKVDPYEPDAHYQAGMVLCEQKLYSQAVDEYELCERLAPGWFFCRSDLWISRQLALGAMPHELFVGLRFLQDGPLDTSKRMELATRMRSQAQAVPLFLLIFGQLLQGTGRQKEAAAQWREALKGDVESDVRTRMLVALSTVEEDAGCRRQLLQEAVELNGNLLAAAAARLSLKFQQPIKKI